MTSKITLEEQPHWDEHIKAYLSSGLSMKKYCQQKELVYHRFQYQWDRYRHDQKNQNAAQARFTKIALNDAPNTNLFYKITCPNGIQCTLPQGLDNVQLIKLLGALIS